MAKPFYITTPIYYVNDKPHVGHAYTSLACDALARFKRLDGFDVMFLTGTDEFGQKIEQAARQAGIPPRTLTDRVSENFRRLAREMNYTNDAFIRTTEARHREAVQAIWQRMLAAGDIYRGTYAGWYAVRDEAFYTEAEVVTGDDGVRRAPSGAGVAWVEEASYFFRLSAWRDRLLAFYDANPDFIGPDSRRNETVAFVTAGLTDLAISRTSFRWGVPVPDAPAHVVYVWVDALTNYITALGYPDTGTAAFKRYWPASLHMVGKDILRFHAVYWPAFLMSAGLPPPQRVFAHGWLLDRGEKMSKSVGNVLDPQDLVARYGLDPLRYYLLRAVPFGQDGHISHEAITGRINADLANDLGNLAQRVLSMIARHCNGAMPAGGGTAATDRTLVATAREALPALRAAFDRQAFHQGLESLWRVVAAANRFVDAEAPWVLRKTDPARMAAVLATLADVVRRIALMLQPVTPDAAARMLDQLGVAPADRQFSAFDTPVPPGRALPRPEPVFPRHTLPDHGNAGASP